MGVGFPFGVMKMLWNHMVNVPSGIECSLRLIDLGLCEFHLHKNKKERKPWRDSHAGRHEFKNAVSR